MPKPKRYENLQNSVYSASTSQGVAQSSSATESDPLHFDDTPFRSRQLNQNLCQQQLTSCLQPTPLVQAAAQPKPSKMHSGRESMQHWTVDVIDSQGAIKKFKVKKRDVLNLSDGERIVVDFDELDSPIGEGQGVLAGFCGILAKDSSIFPIHFKKWSDLPAAYFNHCFDQFIQSRFCFRTTESNARRYVYNSMCKKWGARRLKLYDKVYDQFKSRAEIMDKVPAEIPRDQWISYVEYRFKEKTVEMCKKNADNRKKQTISHIGGSKPNSRRRAEMMAKTGQKPGRGELYLATHRNEDGSYVNEAAKEICEKIELAINQSTTNESEVSANDAIGKVLGKEHSGRVRCLGLGAVPSKTFKQTRPRYSNLNASSYNNDLCSSQCQEKYDQMLKAQNQNLDNYNVMMNAHAQMMNAFKTYIIMKEGTIPEQLAEIFVSTTPSTVKKLS
ncbi:uncharacterized protein LOC125858262 isoform X1 [Solanum stenotomum]|uniref:uncharacterized protein LOC125858262 isoform X1 n=1 Tax=Solanum stenotomum TaxID=172797 RepID=UPI0020D01814|nr:uncharacterized protein LOC125858262 isoform X1 [Solanum stenotomum]XP_049393938.1 uncharacterized protein LOC125858262 isoform X1 [Solanum stenotomum]